MPHRWYHVSHLLLEPGSHVHPGGWGLCLQSPVPRGTAWTIRCLREVGLEYARLCLAPRKPSRLICAFAAPSLAEARRYRNARRAHARIYLVEPQDDLSFCMADHAIIARPDGQDDFAAQMRLAADYWREPAEGYREVLTLSPLTVLEQVD